MSDWTPPTDWQPPTRLGGRYAQLETLRPDHAEALWPAMRGQPDVWTWLFEGPFDDLQPYADHIAGQAARTDPSYYAIGGELGWVGVASFLRIDRVNGSIEIGNLCFAPRLQRSRVATEVIWLLAEAAFSAGFRRLEWKCNALNAPSRNAAARFGFDYEGTFRQHMIVKGRNRDTAWYAILDREWPALRKAYEVWLDDDNFDAGRTQRTRLSDLTGQVVAGLDRP